MAQANPGLGEKIVWWLVALGYDLAEALARALPIDRVSDFGAWLCGWLGPLTSTDRVVETNLRIAFPQASDAEIAALKAEQWRNFGRWAVEAPILDRIVADPSRVEVVGAERLAAIRDGAGPVVFISGHFSSFEIMPAVIVRSGVPCQITYRAMDNPIVDQRIQRSRFRYGVRMFAPKGTSGARQIMKGLSRGESVALMNDQKFNGGVAAPLFGVICHTADGPSSFALRFGIPLQPMSVERKDKARFRVVVHDPIYLEDTGDREADIETGVRRINAFMEQHIRERPAEWWWVHKRWPKEHYKRAKA